MDTTNAVSVDRKAFAAALRAIAPAVAKKTALPILEAVKLEADASGVTQHATDLEKWITRRVDAEPVSGEPFTVLFGHKLLADMLKAGPDRVTLTPHGVNGAKLPTFKADDYPARITLPELESNRPTVLMFAGPLQAALNRVYPFTEINEKYGRPILAGISFRVRGGICTLAGADGFRLAVVPFDVSGPDCEFIVPGSLAKALTAQKLAPDAVVTLTYATYGSRSYADKVFFTWDGGEIFTQLVEGTFPDYNQIIPKTSSVYLDIEADELGRAMTQLHPFAKDNNNVARFHLGALNGAVPISAKSATGGELTVDVSVLEHSELTEENFTPSKRTNSDYTVELSQDYALNETYVRDLCTVAKGSRLRMSLNGTTQSALFVDGTGARYVLMPMVIGAR